ncbi:type VI secretion system Vgr family protein [Paraburkholderia adhaesiva]|uniref:type VI secretion system Vgr family protein n=1 Tax=Paraburkholderia adhaesiva TaxID=2883244 RepID=UPI001F40B167|nr:type VI secretion system Vgr family protein [Paraburkholderia adhaesiva]
MSWFKQFRILELSGAALPTWRDMPLFTVSRLSGKEKLGHLYDYTVEVATIEDMMLGVREAQSLVDVDQLVGKEVTVSIAIEGRGDGFIGAANIGADTRTITGLIVSARCVGADDRRAFYQFRIRPWLWLAGLKIDSRIFQDKTVIGITDAILEKYPYPYEKRLNGPGFRRGYPRRDYQRQAWESDLAYLRRQWQEWGISFFYEDSTLVLVDSIGGYKRHGPAYATLRYLAPEGQRIDEEHISQFGIARTLTTGKVSVTDYDYTQSRADLAAKDQDYQKRAYDNYEEYAWGDYSQPLAGMMGIEGEHNDAWFEGEHLACVRLEAHRAKSLRGKGKGNLRGLMAGHIFKLEGYPQKLGNAEYLVVATHLDIRNNDTSTQAPGTNSLYSCETRFTVQPANTPFRTPQKAKKPRLHSEIAVVTGYDNSPVWTDSYGRARLQFVWDRQGQMDQNSSCWIRAVSPWQGENYGAIFIPRPGQEVVVGYYHGDPDKPYIAGRHVNQFNAPPWVLPHNDALSGWRSQSLEGPGSNTVVTDDTPGKLQVQVSSDQANSRLVLGSNTHIDGNQGRAQARGEGFELATEAHGVARANWGMLITTETRAGASAPVKDMGETVQRLTQARELHEDLSQLAVRHNAQTTAASQQDAMQTIKAQNTAIKGGVVSSSNPSPEMTRPDLVLASAAGVATTATDSTHQASINDHAVTAGRDYSVSAGRHYLMSVRGAISLFAYQLGIRFFAAKGRVEIQAQSDEMALAALKDITISSTDGRIVINAEKEVWIGAGGSYIQINGSGIINGTPGAILEKCATWSKQGAVSEAIPFDAVKPDFQAQYVLVNEKSGLPLPRRPYQLKLPDGRTLNGITTDQGETMPVFTAASQPVQLQVAGIGKTPPPETWHLVGGGDSIFADHKDS